MYIFSFFSRHQSSKEARLHGPWCFRVHDGYSCKASSTSLTLLCFVDSTLIWNAWLDEDLAWLDAFGEPAVSAIHTCWCCGRGTLPGDIWYNTRTGWYDLPYEPGKFLPLHMIHELSNFRVGKNNNTLSRSYFTL